MEKEYGLHRVVRGDRTAAQRPTRAEQEKAHRASHQATARERLRTTVRTAVAVATDPEEFLTVLAGTGVLVDVQRFPSGDIRGYKVALDGDTNTAGQPIWFSGSKLAPDLSFPKIRERLAAAEAAADIQQPGNRPQPDPWHQATAAAERIPALLDQGDDAAAQAHLAAFGEALDALPVLAPKEIRPQLSQAAQTFERATRSRVRAEHHHARALRGAVRSMLREPAPKDGAALAMFLDAAVLVAIAAARWHQARRHDQQVVAARESLLHVQAAYDQAAAAPLAALAQRKPPQRTVERHIPQIRQAAPAHAEQILNDPACDALTTALAVAETAGHDPARLLHQAVDQRALDDGGSPAKVLVWRIQRLTERPAPSPRARAAQARSTTAAQPSWSAQADPTAALPRPGPTPRPGRRP